jgi:hypothetical protein
MKRSEINAAIERAMDVCSQQNFHLPAWAHWKPAHWKRLGREADEVRENGLGWDVTDFGGGEFRKTGLTLITIRNGAAAKVRDPMAKDYCEKAMLIEEDQVTPMHFHWSKMEDIINRAGGKLVIQLYHSDRNERLNKRKKVTVSIDGVEHTVEAGGKVTLKPGESITLAPYVYHSFWAKKGSGPVLAGEVSRVNDDARDNRFLEPLPRFPEIEEDVKPTVLLCTEYPPA